MRWIAILILVLQPLATLSFGAAAATRDGAAIASCAGTDGCCCRPVSCCSVEPVPPCGCIEDEAPAPTKPPLLPSSSDVRTLLSALASPPVPAIVAPAAEHPVIGGCTSAAARARTHNEQQALLCIWRT